MALFLRALRLLAMTTWVGGMAFFAFILAPLAFRTLPTTHDAGIIVGGTLHVLNIVGLACGIIFLLATGALWARSQHRQRLPALELLLTAGMLAATAVVQYRIVPAMEWDRIAAGGDIDAAPLDNRARQDFERLHPISEKVEGAALLLGLVVVVLIATESDATQPTIQAALKFL